MAPVDDLKTLLTQECNEWFTSGEWLQDAKKREMIEQIAKVTFTEESFAFLEAVQRYQDNPTEKSFQEIKTLYIAAGSDKEINVIASKIKPIRDMEKARLGADGKPDPKVFDDLKEAIFKMLVNDGTLRKGVENLLSAKNIRSDRGAVIMRYAVSNFVKNPNPKNQAILQNLISWVADPKKVQKALQDVYFDLESNQDKSRLIHFLIAEVDQKNETAKKVLQGMV